MHALQLNYRANGQRAARHRERAQRPRAALNSKPLLYYCRIQETPRRAQRHQEDRRAQQGIGRDTKRIGGNNGGSERAARPQGSNAFRK
jgi:hypothetical protein